MKLIECVPNFSEGRDESVVRAIRDRIAAVPGVSVLHTTADASHNRSVITFVAPAEAMPDAAVAAVRAARDHIDLTRHAGVHPRIGAADVVPFVPLDGATMEDCIEIAREVGQRVGDELGIPVYLYDHAATRSSRRNLADVRRGGFEALQQAIGSDTDRSPDFGPRRVHPTAGAVAIGARPFLIAFNCYLGDASHLGAAREIARAIRASSGGLEGVKALGLEVDGQAQVSMNIVDVGRAPLLSVYSAVEREAHTRGLAVTWSEIIGLVPESSVLDVASRTLKLRDDIGEHVLERRLLELRVGQPLSEFIRSVGNPDAFPGGGSVAAVAAALAAALVQMVAGLSLGRARYASVQDEMRSVANQAERIADKLQSVARLDAEAYARVVDARKLPARTKVESQHRDDELHDALIAAARVPLEVCKACTDVARLSEIVAERGNSNAITDAGVAAALAGAAATSADYNVRVNIRSLPDRLAGTADGIVQQAAESIASTVDIAARVARLVDAALQPKK